MQSYIQRGEVFFRNSLDKLAISIVLLSGIMCELMCELEYDYGN